MEIIIIQYKLIVKITTNHLHNNLMGVGFSRSFKYDYGIGDHRLINVHCSTVHTIHSV